MAHVRGLHETGGLQALHVVYSKAKPGALTTKLARLDHQRSLLERQLAVWTEKQQMTKHRLSLVQKQMAETGRLIREVGRPRRRSNARQGMRVIVGGQSDGGAVAAHHQKMNLEY